MKVAGSKQSQVPPPRKAATGGFSGKTIGPMNRVKVISNGGLKRPNVGPKNAPYHNKDS